MTAMAMATVQWAAASRDKKTMTMVMGDEDDDSGGCDDDDDDEAMGSGKTGYKDDDNGDGR